MARRETCALKSGAARLRGCTQRHASVRAEGVAQRRQVALGAGRGHTAGNMARRETYALKSGAVRLRGCTQRRMQASTTALGARRLHSQLNKVHWRGSAVGSGRGGQSGRKGDRKQGTLRGGGRSARNARRTAGLYSMHASAEGTTGREALLGFSRPRRWLF